MDTPNGAAAVAQSRQLAEHPLVAVLIAGEPAEAERYAKKLRLDGYVVAMAASLERGLELATMARPDLIFVCLGSSGVPIVLVSDLSRAHLSSEVGGLLTTEQVVSRSSGIHISSDRGASGGTGKRSHRPKNWDRWLPPQR